MTEDEERIQRQANGEAMVQFMSDWGRRRPRQRSGRMSR